MTTTKGFFRKAGNDLKTFFKKGGTLDKTFRKGGSAEKLVNQIGSGINTGIKAVTNVAGKVGGIVGEVAPLVTAVNPELGLALGEVGGLAQQAQQGAQKVKQFKGKVSKGFNNPTKLISATPILAPKPEEMAPDSGGDMTAPDGSAVNFA